MVVVFSLQYVPSAGAKKEEIRKAHQRDAIVDEDGYDDDIYYTAVEDSEQEGREGGEETEEDENEDYDNIEEELDNGSYEEDQDVIPTGRKGQHLEANPSYPWNNEHYMDHAEALLHDMRANMVLEVKEESLPRPLMLQQYKQNILADRKFNRAPKNAHDSPTSTNNGNNDNRESANSKSRDKGSKEAEKDKRTHRSKSLYPNL